MTFLYSSVYEVIQLLDLNHPHFIQELDIFDPAMNDVSFWPKLQFQSTVRHLLIRSMKCTAAIFAPVKNGYRYLSAMVPNERVCVSSAKNLSDPDFRRTPHNIVRQM